VWLDVDGTALGVRSSSWSRRSSTPAEWTERDQGRRYLLAAMMPASCANASRCPWRPSCYRMSFSVRGLMWCIDWPAPPQRVRSSPWRRHRPCAHAGVSSKCVSFLGGGRSCARRSSMERHGGLHVGMRMKLSPDQERGGAEPWPCAKRVGGRAESSRPQASGPGHPGGASCSVVQGSTRGFFHRCGFGSAIRYAVDAERALEVVVSISTSTSSPPLVCASLVTARRASASLRQPDQQAACAQRARLGHLVGIDNEVPFAQHRPSLVARAPGLEKLVRCLEVGQSVRIERQVAAARVIGTAGEGAGRVEVLADCRAPCGLGL